ncbi:MAG TPA: beta-phosphoglucomutase family hydrolase [Bacteroidales bacterium]|jgi:beta-phosphoglucomutase family hydrolase|nr:MAG: Fructose-1-phosphate phosphatase YqaB [Bacteroidetes bacterium ADurb.BinA012]HOE24351.1 beta-phosphoglucomutase family hydrolase [Bacteroidales bacterium]HOR09206.1 beta-phosphoglucomutase family hydrolase [Bacteroidales bacterium]HPH74773.1 beta-phosphoglucomutase family hydrolase [Bacteroidales bacterium]HPO40594.1 beta-phosphoglucomutase family hydrolase [Bacteroidales bacterium]
MPVYDISPGVKGLIFDLDGTLADTMPWHFRAWQKACSRFGITMETEFLQAHTGAPGWEIAGEVIEINGKRGMISPEEILKMKMEEFYKIQHNVTPIEPVIALVKKYHGRLPMSVGTGGHREAVERTLEIVGIRHYFDIIVTAHDVTRHKPHPDTFLRCAELMGVAPEECEVFEDGDLGLRAARNAGMIATDVSKWYESTWTKDLKV